ncbi:LOW QUALITY PROTEIN: hypothetical protein TorRG33x02_055420, partial [Trema orientale]
SCRVQTEFESGFFRASPLSFGLSGSFYILRYRLCRIESSCQSTSSLLVVTWLIRVKRSRWFSSGEVQFRGMSKGLYELLWLRRFLTEIGLHPMLK